MPRQVPQCKGEEIQENQQHQVHFEKHRPIFNEIAKAATPKQLLQQTCFQLRSQTIKLKMSFNKA